MAAEPIASGSFVERAAPARGWGRLDRLRVKLFAAIAGANVALALVAYGVFSWSFDQGFVEYLNRADEARLRPLISRLAEIHEQRGGWAWLAEDTRRWIDTTRAVIGAPRSRRDAPPPPDTAGQTAPGAADTAANGGAAAASSGTPSGTPSGNSSSTSTSTPASPSTSTPPNTSSSASSSTPSAASPAASAPPRQTDPLWTIDPRLMLFDAQRKLLIGRAEMADEAVLKPIASTSGATIGYLGYVPRLKMVESLEKVYSAQQNRKYAAIGAGMLAAGLLVGALLAY
ncbi:MAG: hypothetical protein AB7S98_13845 [Burkholderiaceae bacterium]